MQLQEAVEQHALFVHEIVHPTHGVADGRHFLRRFAVNLSRLRPPQVRTQPPREVRSELREDGSPHAAGGPRVVQAQLRQGTSKLPKRLFVLT